MWKTNKELFAILYFYVTVIITIGNIIFFPSLSSIYSSMLINNLVKRQLWVFSPIISIMRLQQRIYGEFIFF